VDVQQLTSAAAGTSWSLRTATGPDGSGPLADAPPWWLGGGPEPSVPLAPSAGSRPVTRTLATVGAVAALILCLEAVVALLAGMRWFVVETPSMGTAAPVGSLVITKPASAQPSRGDVIAFLPPGTPRVYTHRVFSVAADGGITTKGDINADPDPWTIRHDTVLGTAVAIVPGGGTLLRGVPAFIVGGILLWSVTLLIRRRDRRASARVMGLHLVATAVILWLHPFVQVVLIATESAANGVRASIVSTGLLPVKLVDSAGAVLARLTVGRPEVVALPATSGGADRVTAVPDVGPLLQLVLIGIAVVPSLIVFVVGLPRDQEATT
jgi:signal peptidase I